MFFELPDADREAAVRVSNARKDEAASEIQSALTGLKGMFVPEYIQMMQSSCRQQMPEKVLDPGVPLREKTWGTVHHVLEDIGTGPDKLILNFRYPHELGYEEEKVGTPLCATMMCVNGHGPTPGQGVAAIMTHCIREVEGGSELRSRFWIGFGLENGQVVKLVPDGVSVPPEVPMGLFAHNLKEFGHLATILPQVYAENKDNW